MKRDGGYSLAEALVVTAVVGLMAAALFGVYEVSERAYRRASSLEDAQRGARAGLDRMATELRLIGVYWTGAAGAGPAIVDAAPARITFMADVKADTVRGGQETTTAARADAGTTALLVSSTARQTAEAFNVYRDRALNDFVYVARGATREVRPLAAVVGSTLALAAPLAHAYPAGSLVRSVERVTYAFDPATESLTRSVGGSGAQTIVDRVTDLTLTYLDGQHPPAATTDPARIREIRISLTTRGPAEGLRTVTSSVRLRN